MWPPLLSGDRDNPNGGGQIPIVDRVWESTQKNYLRAMSGVRPAGRRTKDARECALGFRQEVEAEPGSPLFVVLDLSPEFSLGIRMNNERLHR